MLTLLSVVLLGVVVGIFVGLLPSLPVYTGPFLIYYFAPSAPLEYILIFWLVVVSGSQFFGSISTITTGIPGEESSLVYLPSLSSFSIAEKNKLLYETAVGSFIAGLVALIIVYLIIHLFSDNQFLFLSSLNVQLVCYLLAIGSFIFIGGNKLVSCALIVVGLLMSPRNNYAISEHWFYLQQMMQGCTFFILLLGLLVIPELVVSSTQHVSTTKGKFSADKSNVKSWTTIAVSSIIGAIAGLIPGPSASLASIAAFRLCRKDMPSKVVASETANNAAVITCVLPLFLMALPNNQNTLIISNIADLRSVSLTDAIHASSQLINFSIIDLTLLCVAISLLTFFLLSTRLIDKYCYFVQKLHHKLTIIMICIVVMMASLDIYSAEISTVRYIAMLSGLSVIGIAFKKYKISPMPLMFSIILGDKIVWIMLQFYKLHF